MHRGALGCPSGAHYVLGLGSYGGGLYLELLAKQGAQGSCFVSTTASVV